jgi:N6-L-threonylcarbamoyladenine synthase
MLLALETSCDETSAAVVHEGRILSNIVSSQTDLHAEYGGVVPELAAREHLKNLLPATRAALSAAKVEPSRLDAVAATQGPGLPSALMAGMKAAQAIAFALHKPFLGIHHHEAHLYSPWIAERGNSRRQEAQTSPSKLQNEPPYTSTDTFGNFHADFSAIEPNVSLIVSGGHTLLVHVRGLLDHTVLGGTLDDAAGECFDKAGKLIGLPYPAGPAIDRLAERGNPRAHDFPRPMLNEPHDDFSFSGLKTSLRYFLRDNPGLVNGGDEQPLCDLCASVQAAIVEVLVTRTLKAARRLRVKCVTASGGVTRNRALRRELAVACDREGLTLRLAPAEFCTDNAAMIAVLAEAKLRSGAPRTSLDADIQPNKPL